MMLLSELSDVDIVISGGNQSVAQTATAIVVDPADAALYKTSIVNIVYEALEDEFGAFEKLTGNISGGVATMSFTDNSVIIVAES
jgi:pyruvate/2-oxoacid:ferredoxin oxidoreductase alpha subunit